jgi:hypothetical protein
VSCSGGKEKRQDWGGEDEQHEQPKSQPHTPILSPTTPTATAASDPIVLQRLFSGGSVCFGGYAEGEGERPWRSFDEFDGAGMQVFWCCCRRGGGGAATASPTTTAATTTTTSLHHAVVVFLV